MQPASSRNDTHGKENHASLPAIASAAVATLSEIDCCQISSPCYCGRRGTTSDRLAEERIKKGSGCHGEVLGLLGRTDRLPP